MTSKINPLPESLAHLEQRDRYVRDRTIEYAILVCEGVANTYPNSRFGVDQCLKRLSDLLAPAPQGQIV